MGLVGVFEYFCSETGMRVPALIYFIKKKNVNLDEFPHALVISFDDIEKICKVFNSKNWSFLYEKVYLKQEIKNWIAERLCEESYVYFCDEIMPIFVMFFKNKEDAMLFKITWK